MSTPRHRELSATAFLMAFLAAGIAGYTAHDAAQASVNSNRARQNQVPAALVQSPAPVKPQPDRSGLQRTGVASFYADSFSGREMADGTPMDPGGDNAASRTLPLGTTAKVTNISTGKSALVTIQDRGPYAKGRLVDLSPATAHKIGISHQQGVARVSVTPIAVPIPDGTVKPGRAAADPEIGHLR